MRYEKIKRLTFTAMMTAVAFVLSFAESLLPAASFMMPGSKLGLSNIAVMFAASSMSIGDTAFIIIAKAFFALITRGVTAFLMSLAGGLLSGACMLIIFRKIKGFGYIGTGVASALCHNLGQLLVSLIIMRTPAVLGYAPVLIAASVGTGILTGVLLKFAMPYLKRLDKYIIKERKV